MNPSTHRARWIAGCTAAAVSMLLPWQAYGWGHTGHVQISRIAIDKLPDEIPFFLRSALAMGAVGELGAEADESKTTGVITRIDPVTGFISTTRSVHDAERDNGHFIDLDDNSFVVGGVVPLSAVGAVGGPYDTREHFDTAQRMGGQTQYTGGYLPYQMLDGFQQVRKDFGMWRAFRKGYETARSREDRAYFAYHLALRETLLIRDIGYWSHFVADASQPMHVSVHFNGWQNLPNPNGFTQAPIHAPFEGSFVRSFVNFKQVEKQVRGYTDRGVDSNEERVPLYLAETLAQLVPVYEAAKESNNDNYATAQPKEVAIVTRQLAAGAAELRDEIVDAWRQSTEVTVGFPLVPVADILSGKTRITPDTFGAD